jgi:hypothetical protein
MMMRTNRVAWGLIWVLAVAVLAGSVVLGVQYRRVLPQCPGDVTLLPPGQWGFGKATEPVIWYGSALGTYPIAFSESLKLGFFSVRLK